MTWEFLSKPKHLFILTHGISQPGLILGATEALVKTSFPPPHSTAMDSQSPWERPCDARQIWQRAALEALLSNLSEH